MFSLHSYSDIFQTVTAIHGGQIRQPGLHRGEASVYKAMLCAQTNDAHL